MPLVQRTQIIDRLIENRIPFAEVPLQSGVTILISQLGGRTWPASDTGQRQPVLVSVYRWKLL
jgi:hypothetical protein